MEITKKDFYGNYFKKTKDGFFTPIYEYKHYDIETETYTKLVIVKTAEEVYKEWLENKDKEVDKTKISPTTDELKEENERLKEDLASIQDMLIMLTKNK